MNATQRQEFRQRLQDVSETKIIQRLFLLNLVGKIDTELACYHALFEPESELEPGLDAQVAGLNLMLTQELKRRSSAKAKLQKLAIIETEGEINVQNGHSNKS